MENLLDWCEELDIKIVTLYALSAENMDRNNEELEYLYELIRIRLEKLYNDPRIHRCKMRVTGIGRIESLPESIKEVLKRLDDATKNNDHHLLSSKKVDTNGLILLKDKPIKIGELIDKINVVFIQKKYNFQSQLNIKSYNLMWII